MFLILLFVSIALAVLFGIWNIAGDYDSIMNTITGVACLIACFGCFVFIFLSAFFDPSRYVVYKKEDQRVWLEKDGKYIWVDNLNAPDEGNVIYLSYSDLMKYHTSKD